MNANLASCQEEHETPPSADSRATKKSLRPSSIFAGVFRLFLGT
jgi:hypothetical protein